MFLGLSNCIFVYSSEGWEGCVSVVNSFGFLNSDLMILGDLRNVLWI